VDGENGGEEADRSDRAMAAYHRQTKSGTGRERKFLVRRLPPRLARYPYKLLEPDYLATLHEVMMTARRRCESAARGT